MSLNPQERRRIRQIEQQLQESDPELDKRMRGEEPTSFVERVAAWCLLLVGLALTTVPLTEGVEAPLLAFVTLVGAGWLFVRIRRAGSRSARRHERSLRAGNGSPTR